MTGLIHLVGVPFDGASSFLAGAADAPESVRRVLASGSANWCTEGGVDLDPARTARWRDDGDLELVADPAAAMPMRRTSIGTLLADDGRVVGLGGDHLVTWPIVGAHAAVYESLTVLHFDAHPDFYDELDGQRLSHACPFARIMEEGAVDRLVQVGIRTMTPQCRTTNRVDCPAVSSSTCSRSWLRRLRPSWGATSWRSSRHATSTT